MREDDLEMAPHRNDVPRFADASIDAIYKVLANPVRRQILAWLREPYEHFSSQELSLGNGVSAGSIEARCGLSQSTVSAHLGAMQRSGLVTSHRVGQWVFFRRNKVLIDSFAKHVAEEM